MERVGKHMDLEKQKHQIIVRRKELDDGVRALEGIINDVKMAENQLANLQQELKGLDGQSDKQVIQAQIDKFKEQIEGLNEQREEAQAKKEELSKDKKKIEQELSKITGLNKAQIKENLEKKIKKLKKDEEVLTKKLKDNGKKVDDLELKIEQQDKETQ